MGIKKKFYTYFIISMFIVSIFVFLSWTMFDLIRTESSNLRESQAYLIELDKRGDKIKESASEYDSIQKNIEKMESSLLKDDQDLDLVLLIENVAKKNGLSHEINISEAAKSAKKSKSKDEEKLINLKLSGTFPGILRFLNFMENAPYYLGVKSVSMNRSGYVISGDGSGAEELEISASIVIKAYVFK